MSNEVPPRILVVCDMLLFTVKTGQVKNYNLSRRLHRYKSCVSMMHFNPLTMSYIKDLSWRRHIRVDGITFEGPGIAEALQDFFDSQNLGVGYTTNYDSPNELGRAMAYMPDVVKVLHADERVQMAVGSRGFNGSGPTINGALY